MIALFGTNRVIPATASGAMTLGRAVTLTLSSGALIATAAAAGGRIDGFVHEPAEDGKQVAIELNPGTSIFVAEAAGTTVAGDPVFNYATGTLGPASQTLAGQYAGIALEAVTVGQRFKYIAQTIPNGVRLFRKVAVSGDGVAGYIDFTHNFGANPEFHLAMCYVVTTGAARVMSSVTYPDTNTIRCTVASLTTGDILMCLCAKKGL